MGKFWWTTWANNSHNNDTRFEYQLVVVTMKGYRGVSRQRESRYSLSCLPLESGGRHLFSNANRDLLYGIVCGWKFADQVVSWQDGEEKASRR